METLDPAQARPYRGAMSEEGSKRIDDLRTEWRADLSGRFGESREEPTRMDSQEAFG